MAYDEPRVHHLGDGTPWPGDPGPADTAAPDEIASSAPTGRSRRIATGAAIVAIGVIAGAVGTSAVQATRDSNNVAQSPVAASSDDQAAPDDQNGQGFALPPGGFSGGTRGGLAGEQRLLGTVAAVGARSIRVTTSGGTMTYAVTSSTDIRRDGVPIALSALRTGETVLVHVYPTGSSYAAERIFAGSSDGAPPATGTGTTTGNARVT